MNNLIDNNLPRDLGAWVVYHISRWFNLGVSIDEEDPFESIFRELEDVDVDEIEDW